MDSAENAEAMPVFSIDTRRRRETSEFDEMKEGLQTTPIDQRVIRAIAPRADDTARPVSQSELVEALVISISTLSQNDQIDEGINLIFTKIDTWLRSGEFGLVDRFISSLDTYDLHSEIILAPLAITFVAKSQLSVSIRTDYIERARGQLHEIHEPAYADELIARFQ